MEATFALTAANSRRLRFPRCCRTPLLLIFKRRQGQLPSHSQWWLKGRGAAKPRRAPAASAPTLDAKLYSYPMLEGSDGDCIEMRASRHCLLLQGQASLPPPGRLAARHKLNGKAQRREDKVMLSTSRQHRLSWLRPFSSANFRLGTSLPRKGT